MDDNRFADADRPAPSRRLTSALAASAYLATTMLAASLAMTTSVHAQLFWMDEAPAPVARKTPPRRVHQRAPKISNAAKEQSKPSGPVVIAISIQKQQLKIYDSNGLFAESPVSTGMAGHSTPMGVFSVIGKEVFHRSNIYSGAPMPHMQRITWSGVAMHAGVLPGYPASHGCIRMPPSFATRMYGWTSKGARVVIAPGELAPEDFAHRNLITKRLTLPDPNMPVVSLTAIAPATQVAADEKSALAELKRTFTTGETTRMADASASMAVKTDAVSDAGPADKTDPDTIRVEVIKGDGIKDGESKPDAATAADAARAADNALDKAVAEATGAKADDKIPDAVADKTEAKTETKIDATAAAPAARAAAAPPTPAVAATPAPVVATPVIETPATPPLPGTAEFIGPTKPRTGQIAAFISGKEKKLFVRQNFEPLFDVPVTIAPGDKPLGTHVFTARLDKADAETLRWSVVSLPAPSRAARRDEISRHRRKAAAEPAPVPAQSTATEALDRITIPEDAMKRIAGAIGPGGSLVVSDQGLGNETGLGTEFIVTQR